MSGWQPIETADHEHGDRVLGFDPSEGIEIMYWSESSYMNRDSQGKRYPGWECPAAHDNGTFFRPTHWMPLPDEPK